MKLHSKQLGAIGVLRVAAHLMSKGLSVFAEMGDLARVDLIVLVDDQPIKIQVKTRNLKEGKISVDSRKSGPGDIAIATNQKTWMCLRFTFRKEISFSF